VIGPILISSLDFFFAATCLSSSRSGDGTIVGMSSSVYDVKKNPGGRTGYPENHSDSFFVSPKCGKRMGLTGYPNSNPRGLNLK
jgi:hypothetical protein